MAEVNISINIGDGSDGAPSRVSSPGVTYSSEGSNRDSLNALRQRHEELVAQMGDEISPFPEAKVGGYMSHFRITMKFEVPPLKGKTMSVVSPMAAQSVAWSAPFIY